MDVGEIVEDVNRALENTLATNKTDTREMDVNTDPDLPELDEDPFTSDPFFNPDVVHDMHCCKRMLYWSFFSTQDSASSIRTWDMIILLSNGLFLAFLISGFRNAKQKLVASNSAVFAAFYALVFTAAAVGVARALFCMFISTVAGSVGDEMNKILWLILRFVLMATEMSVLTFGLASGHLDTKAGTKRVVLVSSAASIVFSVTQGALELFYPDPNFTVHFLKLDLFGHGGMLFWLLSSTIFTFVYGFVLVLPLLPCRHFLALPQKRAFYYYAGYLMILNLIQAVGSGLVSFGADSGLCFVNIGTFLYFTTFAPLVYYTFLKGFFTNVAQPSLLFSYRAQVDDIEDDLINREDDENGLRFSTRGLDDDRELNQASRPSIIMNSATSNADQAPATRPNTLGIQQPAYY